MSDIDKILKSWRRVSDESRGFYLDEFPGIAREAMPRLIAALKKACEAIEPHENANVTFSEIEQILRGEKS